MLILLLVGVLFIVLAPQWWVKHTLKKYAQPADRYASSGAELARHLLDEAGLQAVVVEQTLVGDHYDPIAKAVRLSELCHGGRSLTAITVAAHEVGHAIQDAQNHSLLRLRTRFAPLVMRSNQVAMVLLIAAPIVAIASRSAILMWALVAISIAVQAMAALLHLITLPVEIDASFGRALPQLKRLGILHESDYPHARRLLLAASATYLSASLFSLLVLLRWIR